MLKKLNAILRLTPRYHVITTHLFTFIRFEFEFNCSKKDPIETPTIIDMREAVFLYRDQGSELNLATSTTPKAIQTNDPPVSLDINSNNRPEPGKKQGRRDERRRATHNEVERRRRDKINNWIMKLGSIIPDTCEAPSRHGPVDGLSKGGILAAACEYIGELKDENENLTRQVSTLCETSQFLVEENTRLQQENQQIKEILLRNGIQLESPPESINTITKEEAELPSDVVALSSS